LKEAILQLTRNNFFGHNGLGDKKTYVKENWKSNGPQTL